MSARTVVLELAGDHQLARDLVAGGVFVPDVLKLGEDLTLVLSNGDELLELRATCVFVDANKGSGLQLIGCDADMKQRIVALASGMGLSSRDEGFGADTLDEELRTETLPVDRLSTETLPVDRLSVDDRPSTDKLPVDDELRTETLRIDDRLRTEQFPVDDALRVDLPTDPSTQELPVDHELFTDVIPAAEAAALYETPEGEPPVGEPSEGDTDPERKIALNAHERLRGLTLVQQIRVAQKGEVSERIVLERMYGKNVWEPLLRNPRITGPEVARISRMGQLPRPLIELIVGNGGWLQIPEVRRALLSNPRLGTDQIYRVLRLLPKHELKLAGMQTAYPPAVRDAAKRMLRDMGG